MNEIAWAKPAVGIFTLVSYVAVFVMAYLAKSDTAMTLLTGASVAMTGTVIQYYFGSSSSSDKKTDLIAAQNPVKPVPTAP